MQPAGGRVPRISTAMLLLLHTAAVTSCNRLAAARQWATEPDWAVVVAPRTLHQVAPSDANRRTARPDSRSGSENLGWATKAGHGPRSSLLFMGKKRNGARSREK